jgi:hypothetical protein
VNFEILAKASEKLRIYAYNLTSARNIRREKASETFPIMSRSECRINGSVSQEIHWEGGTTYSGRSLHLVTVNSNYKGRVSLTLNIESVASRKKVQSGIVERATVRLRCYFSVSLEKSMFISTKLPLSLDVMSIKIRCI